MSCHGRLKAITEKHKILWLFLFICVNMHYILYKNNLTNLKMAENKRKTEKTRGYFRLVVFNG